MLKTIKGKLSTLYILLVVLIAIVGYVSTINLYSLSNTIDKLMTNNYASITASSNMLQCLEAQNDALNEFWEGDHDKGMHQFSENQINFESWYAKVLEDVAENGENDYILRIRGKYDDFLKAAAAIFSDKNNSLENQNAHRNDIENQFSALKNDLKSLSAINEKVMISTKDRAVSHTKNTMQTILLITTIAVLSGFIISAFFVNTITSPIYSLIESIKKVRKGNLHQEITVSSKDEMGELAKEFNSMTSKLMQYEQNSITKIEKEQSKSLAILNNISDPLIVLDRDFRFSLINKAFEKYFNIKEAKTLGKLFAEVINDADLFKHISNTANLKDKTNEKVLIIKPQDEEQYYNVIVTCITNTNGSVTDWIVIFQNVTQYKELEKIKTDFISTVSHEFKTPLTSIMMGASMIEDGTMGPLNEQQKEIMETIKDDGERLTVLVSDLLELARNESGKSIYKYSDCSIENIIESSVKNLNRQIIQKNINLNVSIGNNLPKIYADEEKITWVMNNLLVNALKYTESEGEIAIQAFTKNGLMHVSVSDTGIGIPMDYREKIFDRFFQVKNHDVEVRGTGLGLSIVKEIINSHDGKIWCDKEVSKGSRFVFTLPLSR